MSIGVLVVLLCWLIPSLFLFHSFMWRGLSSFIVGSLKKRIIISFLLSFAWIIIIPLMVLGLIVDFILLVITKKQG